LFLLSTAFNKLESETDKKEIEAPGSPAVSDANMEDEEVSEKLNSLVSMFIPNIKTFMEVFVVGKREQKIKTISMHFVKGLWMSADEKTQDTIFNAILSVPMQSSSAWLISFILKKKTKSKNSSQNIDMSHVFEFVKKSLTQANNLILFSHQNLELYAGLYPIISNGARTIDRFGASVKVSGTNGQNMFIFEREPCMKCYQGNTEDFMLQNVNDIKNEMKSNEQSQVYKLISPMAIKEVILNMHELKGTKRVSEVSIYVNTNQKADLSAIKRDKSVWTYIMTMKVTEERGDKKCKFPVPITACNLMFEFHVVKSNKTSISAGSASYSNPYGSGYDDYGGFKYNSYLGRSSAPYQTFSVNNRDVLNCPRCHTIVEDSHGVCNGCRDNAFQCTYCHNINYENLEAFLCNECGLSRYGKFEFSVLAKPDFVVEKNAVEDLSEVESYKKDLSQNKETILNYLKQMNNSDGNSPINDIQSVFSKSMTQYQTMMKNVQKFCSIRKQLLEKEAKDDDSDESESEDDDDDTEQEFTSCFG
jgi:hypothetical protein